MFNAMFKENVPGGNNQWVAHLQSQNYLVTESLENVVQKVKNDHKNPDNM